MTFIPLDRRAFIVGTAAAAAGSWHAARRPRTQDRELRSADPKPLALRGVNYDTVREVWRPEYVRREIETIAGELNCNAVILLGDNLDRLTESAAIAAEQGLSVWFEPRHWDASAADTIEFVAGVARAAEELRVDHSDVGLSLGVEYTIFMDGLVPGNDWSERGEALGRIDRAEYNGKLNEFLAEALPVIRPIFGGQITYSSGAWEEVDWRDFDVVGIDLYRDATNAATFVDHVRSLLRHGKPVVITEFGCCTFQGAEDMGGTGFMVVDWWADDPTVAEGLVRDESVQATYIEDSLDIFEAEGLHGAFIYNFIQPDGPYSPDPRYDFDMAGFGVVKVFPSGTEQAYDTTGHFEPKQAFNAIARRFS